MGVRQDIVAHAPHVKDGGIIGFHDIGHIGVNPWTLVKEGSDRLFFEMRFKPPDMESGYSYYGDPFVDLEFEFYDFEELGAIRWKKDYQAAFEKSLYVYPLDLVAHSRLLKNAICCVALHPSSLRRTLCTTHSSICAPCMSSFFNSL